MTRIGTTLWDEATVARVALRAAALGRIDPEAHPGALLDKAQRDVLPDGPWLASSYCNNTHVWSKALKTAFDKYKLRERVKRRQAHTIKGPNVLLHEATLEQVLLRQAEIMRELERGGRK